LARLLRFVREIQLVALSRQLLKFLREIAVDLLSLVLIIDGRRDVFRQAGFAS
jgi:hypothetical protein